MSEGTITRSEKQRRPQQLYLQNRLATSTAVAASKNDTIVQVRIPVERFTTALEAGKDLNSLTAAELMIRDSIAVHTSTPIAATITLVADQHILPLPVGKNGAVTYSVARHDPIHA
ncbi:MAG: hypothetical protein WBB60_15845 [Nitrospira sp.]